MGRGTVSEQTVRIELAGGLWVEAKSQLSYGDQCQIRAAFMAYETRMGADGQPVVVPTVSGAGFERSRGILMERAIRKWNLELEDGKPLPITAEAIDKHMDGAVAQEILVELDKLYAPPTQEHIKN